MSTQTERLVADESSAFERTAAGLVGLGVLSILLGWAALFQWTAVTETILGVQLFDLFGLALSALGLGVIGMGIASYTELVDTQPDDSAGLSTGVVFGLFGFIGTGLVGAVTLGLGALGWAPLALVGGLAVAAVTVVPREDIGSTLPAGLFSLVLGALVLGGVLTPDWTWNPDAFSITLTGTIVVPLLTIVGSLVGAWAGAKAFEGFGARGRQTGAYMFIAMNAVGMLAILLLLVTFVANKGFTTMVDGIRLGFFWEPVFWFHAPILEKFVIFDAPGVWFYWPFVMEATSLSPDVADGVFPAVVGTVWLVVGAVTFAVPLGIGAAVFLTEYAEQSGFTRIVEIATNGLWSTPSVVYGLFGYAFLVPRFGNTTSLLAGQLVLGFMLLPLVIITSREALKSVPDEYRDASAALGVNQWETIKSVVLPAAMPGVITGVILGVGRIAGETAPILLVTAGGLNAPAPNVLGSFQFTSSPPFIANPALLTSANALPYKLFAIITSGVSGNESFGWATALVLLLVVLSFFGVGIVSRIYFRRKLEQ